MQISLQFPLLTFCLSEVHRAKAKKTGAVVALKKIIMHNEKDGVRVAISGFPKEPR